MELEEALQQARKVFGSDDVERYQYDMDDLAVWTFVGPGDPWDYTAKRQFYIVSQDTGRGVLYDMGPDAQTQYAEGTWSLLAGFQSQSYVLEIREIKKWAKSLMLLEAMGLDASQLDGAGGLPNRETRLTKLGKRSLQSIIESQGALRFVGVNVNLEYQRLFAAKCFKCFGYKL